MKNIYLFGTSDDCCECETDFNDGFESYSGIKINDIEARYQYISNWDIRLQGIIPKNWIVRKINGNDTFIHIQAPDDCDIVFSDLESEE